MSTPSPISVDSMVDADLPAVVALLTAQATRLHLLDSRLERPPSAEQTLAKIEAEHYQASTAPLVARNAAGHVRGYVLPSLFEVAPHDALRGFYTARNGRTPRMGLPAPAEPDALPVAAALLTALDEFWTMHHTTGDIFAWPSGDLWMEPLLLNRGFASDFVFAYHPPHPLIPAVHPSQAVLHTRLARPEDEEMLLALAQEELSFHLPYTPFSRLVPALETAFRASLARLWAGESVEAGAPRVVVVEQEGKVVAMAETYVSCVTEEDPPGVIPRRLPSGRYVYLRCVSVHEGVRGKGIGRVLVQGVFAAFAQEQLNGYSLGYVLTNPLSSRFWPHLGFLPLWTQYQRLHPASG